MKSSLIPLLTSLVLTLGSQTLIAQPGQGGGGGMGMGNPEARVAELIATLEITSEQEAAFRQAMGQINEMQRAAMQEMMQNGGGMRQGGAMPGDQSGGSPVTRGTSSADGAAATDAHQHGSDTAAAGDAHQHGGDAAAAGDHAGHDQAAGQASGGGMRQGGGGMDMMMARRAEMQQKAEELLSPVLSAAQMAKYRETEAARMEQMRERMGQRGQ